MLASDTHKPSDQPTLSAVPSRMKAIVHERYGRPNVLTFEEVDVPALEDDRVLLRVHASSVNPVEWYGVTGPIFARVGNGMRRPKETSVGGDVSGRVVAVGKDVQSLEVGDEVFGTAIGSWAEYATAREARLARKPANLSFEEAATVPVAGLTALQALRDHGEVQAGQNLLINGASGGVGTFAVQLAKAFEAEVTGVCSTRNVELVRSLGADLVIDYTQEDFTRGSERYDLMLDIAGSRPFSRYRRVLKPQATIVLVGGPMTYRGLGPLRHIARSFVTSKGRSQTLKFFVAKITTEDLDVMRELIEAGKVRPAIDRSYDLADAPEALEFLGTHHAPAKIGIRVAD